MFYHAICKDNLFSVIAPIVFSCLIALTNNSNIMLNSHGVGMHSCLVPDLGGNTSVVFLLDNILALGYICVMCMYG